MDDVFGNMTNAINSSRAFVIASVQTIHQYVYILHHQNINNFFYYAMLLLRIDETD